MQVDSWGEESLAGREREGGLRQGVNFAGDPHFGEIEEFEVREVRNLKPGNLKRPWGRRSCSGG